MNQAVLNRARNDKFQLVLDLPKIMKPMTDLVLQSGYEADRIQFTCFGSPVPSINIPHIDVPFGGQVYKTSSNSRPSYPPLTISFMVDNGWKNYWILWKWLDQFNQATDGSTAYNFGDRAEPVAIIPDRVHIPMKDMVSKFSTFVLDEYNNRIISFDYSHVFPTSLSEINFSHQDPSEITCKVSFAYYQIRSTLLKNVDSVTC